MKRVKRRYLALTIDSREAFGSNEFMHAVWAAVSRLYGEYGASRTGLSLIGYNGERKLVILRTVHTTLGMVRTALASITKIEGKPTAVHVLAVSGTLKALHQKIDRA